MSQKNSFQEKQNAAVLNTAPKKIGFMSAIIMTIGCCIGSGIFFKSGTVMMYSNNSLLLSLGSWLIAGLAVIAMAIALIDIASQSKKDNRGFLSWIRKFNSLFTYKLAKNFFAFFYIPINWFILPVYLFQSLQSGLCYIGAEMIDGQIQFSQFGINVLNFPWWGVLIITVIVTSWFIIWSGLSVKFGNYTSLIINSIKFIPLVFALVIGFIIVGINGTIPPENSITYEPVESVDQPLNFFSLTPVFGVFMSLSAIFFAYDGFYIAAGLGSKLKNPKKIPWILLTGLLLATVIYLSIALSITLGAKGGQWDNIGEFFVAKNLAWIYVIVNVIIAVGILGTINAYAIWGPMLYEDLLNDHEAPLAKRLHKHLHKKKPYVGTIYQYVLGIPVLIIFIIVGAFGYTQADGYYLYISNGANNFEIAYVYAFCDLISNWLTVIAFAFIAIAILMYAIKKIKEPTKKSSKEWLFIFCGLFSSLVVLIGLGAQFVAPFVDLGLQVSWNNSHHDNQVSIISNVCLIVILFALLALSIIPTIFEIRNPKVIQLYKLQIRVDDLNLKVEQLNEEKQKLIEQSMK